MYYLRNDQDFKDLSLTEADRKGLTLACAQLSLFDPRTAARWRATVDGLLRRR